MRPNAPKYDEVVAYFHGEPIAACDFPAPNVAASLHLFQIDGRMARILEKQFQLFIGRRLNVLRQTLVIPLETFRVYVLQGAITS